MSIDYSALLSDEQKKSILEQRLTQFAAEAYQHSINKQIAEASNNADAVKTAEDALEILDKSITFHQEELAKLSTDLGA